MWLCRWRLDVGAVCSTERTEAFVQTYAIAACFAEGVGGEANRRWRLAVDLGWCRWIESCLPVFFSLVLLVAGTHIYVLVAEG